VFIKLTDKGTCPSSACLLDVPHNKLNIQVYENVAIINDYVKLNKFSL
jgi:hypothetical protein